MVLSRVVVVAVELVASELSAAAVVVDIAGTQSADLLDRGMASAVRTVGFSHVLPTDNTAVLYHQQAIACSPTAAQPHIVSADTVRYEVVVVVLPCASLCLIEHALPDTDPCVVVVQIVVVVVVVIVLQAELYSRC